MNQPSINQDYCINCHSIVLKSTLLNCGGICMKCKNNDVEKIDSNISDENILKLIQQGQIISALKMYMTLHGVGLKDAKDAIEKTIDNL